MTIKEYQDNFIELVQQFEKEYAELGKGKNYYYYKLIYDRIKEDNN